MLLPLSLQSALQGLSATDWITLSASLLSAAAAIYATSVAARTQREATQTTREAARIAADSAREVTDRSYKQDFYKKIIEKRLGAWADAEQALLPLMATVYLDELDGRPRFRFMAGPARFAAMLEAVNAAIISHTFWIGGEYARVLNQFREKLQTICNECFVPGQYNEKGTPLCAPAQLYEAGAAYHEEIGMMFIQMALALNKQMLTLHDAEGFLAGRVVRF